GRLTRNLIYSTKPAGGFVKRKYLVDKIFHAGFKGITTSEPGLW
ncbi:TPA: hypothetical protein ACNTYH_005439, partial [Klebsiella pneumoniae]